MKITVTSDLHGDFPETPGGDLLIIAGDMTTNDSVKQWKLFYDWLAAQNYRQKVYIGGNHDNFLAQSISSEEERAILDVKPTNTEYLRDSGMEFEGLKIWGSPWTADFPEINPHCTAFTIPWQDQDALNAKWAMIPDDIEILITHGPPFEILDSNFEGVCLGSMGLRERIAYLPRLKLHVFGHIHESYGKYWSGITYFGEYVSPIFINASHMNAQYEGVNPPITIDL